MRREVRTNAVTRSIGGLMMLVVGAIGFSMTAPDSWIAQIALLIHLAGLALLYTAARRWTDRTAGSDKPPARPRSTGHGCAIAIFRATLILTMIASAGWWLWFAAIDLNEMRLLVTGGRTATAQFIGKEIVSEQAPIGYVHYAYRVSPTMAPEDRMAVPRADYAGYTIGTRFEVTYAAADPRVHRIGSVGWLAALRRLTYWLLILANGAAYLFLPLWLLELRRRPAKAGTFA